MLKMLCSSTDQDGALSPFYAKNRKLGSAGRGEVHYLLANHAPVYALTTSQNIDGAKKKARPAALNLRMCATSQLSTVKIVDEICASPRTYRFFRTSFRTNVPRQYLSLLSQITAEAIHKSWYCNLFCLKQRKWNRLCKRIGQWILIDSTYRVKIKNQKLEPVRFLAARREWFWVTRCDRIHSKRPKIHIKPLHSVIQES